MEYTDEIHAEMAELKSDLQKLRSDLGDVLRTIVDATRSEAGEARERMETKAREQVDRFAATIDGMRDQGRVMADRVFDQIETHPMASILSALGAGFLIGFMAGKK